MQTLLWPSTVGNARMDRNVVARYCKACSPWCPPLAPGPSQPQCLLLYPVCLHAFDLRSTERIIPVRLNTPTLLTAANPMPVIGFLYLYKAGTTTPLPVCGIDLISPGAVVTLPYNVWAIRTDVFVCPMTFLRFCRNFLCVDDVR